jgi:nucleotide-binding universal stress UspA family protein
MFKHILVAVDGSPPSNRGLASALALASDQGADVLLLHVIDELAIVPPLDLAYVPANYVDTVVDEMREHGRKVLERAEKQARERGLAVRTVLADSHGRTVAHAILAQASKARADLIVLGTHGRRGLRRLVLGSDAESVLHEATCPVLLVRTPERADATRSRKAKPARSPSADRRAAKRRAAAPATASAG